MQNRWWRTINCDGPRFSFEALDGAVKWKGTWYRKRASRTKPVGARRHGLAMVAVLICMLVVMLLSTALLQAVAQQHRWIRSSQHQEQSFWLAEAALQRAAYQLQRSPEYSGEEWVIAAEVLGQPARVLIQVETAGEDTSRRRVHVAARYPDVKHQRVLTEKEIVVPVATGEE
jgi:Tfp pilus assembly protein PilX